MPKCAATRACSGAGSERRKVAVASTRRWARGSPERLPHLSKRGLCPAQGFRRELTLCG